MCEGGGWGAGVGGQECTTVTGRGAVGGPPGNGHIAEALVLVRAGLDAGAGFGGALQLGALQQGAKGPAEGGRSVTTWRMLADLSHLATPPCPPHLPTTCPPPAQPYLEALHKVAP